MSKLVDLRPYALGVGIVITRGGRYLLGLRRAALGFRTWGFPGGSVEVGETPQACAERELREETGMELRAQRSSGWSVFADAENRYLTLYVLGHAIGNPLVCEPDKCEQWRWFARDELPQELFPPTSLYFQQK